MQNVIKKEYLQESAAKTLRTGQLVALSAIVVIAYFAYLDQAVLQLHDSLHWRLIGWIGFAIFAIGSYTFLKTYKRAIIPLYTVAIACLLIMMTGMTSYIFTTNGTQEQKVAVIVGFMSVWFLVSLIAFGSRKYVLMFSVPILVFLFLTSSQDASIDQGLIMSVILVGIFANIIIYLQEKNEFQKFQFIKELEFNKNTLAKQKNELEILNRELESFNYSISHDLRTPLRIANSFAQLLEQKLDADNDEETQEYLDHITGNVRKMHDLINDLLNLSKVGKKILRFESINTQELIDEIVRTNHSQHKNRDIQVNIADVPDIYADRTLITQVFGNLINNAFKYTSKRKKAIIEIGAYSKNGNQIFFVKDNGAGFNMSYQDKLFKAFKRLHDDTEFEGTGVGLAIVDRIIKYHAGQIWAEGEIDKGATFYFSLPEQK
jgi:two-component system sensor kinase